MGSSGRAVQHRTVNRGDGGSIPPATISKHGNFIHPTFACSFGRDANAETHKTKRAICKLCRLSVTKNYFFNVSPQMSTLLLLLRSGDVSTNPGPFQNKRKYTPKNPCSRCDKGVTARSRAISCDSCGQWTHNRCASVFSDVTYDELCNSGAHFTFVCQRCSFYALPFANDTTDGNIPEIITPSNVDDEERSLDGIDNESDQFKCFFKKRLAFFTS